MTTKWYHGSNRRFTVLRAGSTVTPNRALAESFSHKPSLLSCEKDGTILHNGRRRGFLYIVEPFHAETDFIPHPRTTLPPGAEYLTTRPLRVRLIAELGRPDTKAHRSAARRLKAKAQGVDSLSNLPSVEPQKANR